MDRKLSNSLADSLRDIERGSLTIDECIARHPERADALRAHLELWQSLERSSRAEPSNQGQQRGLNLLMSRLSSAERHETRVKPTAFMPTMARVAAVAAGAFLLVGGVAGASAAFGGPDVTENILSGIGIGSASDTGVENANDNAFEGAANGSENANDNAFEGADNAGEGIENASETGQEHANENAAEGAENAGQGAANASETGQEHANENATEGSENANQGVDNAPQTGPPGP